MNDNNGKYNHLSTILPDTFSIPSSESDVSSPAMAQQAPDRNSAFQFGIIPPLSSNGLKMKEFTNGVSVNMLLGLSENERYLTVSGAGSIVSGQADGICFEIFDQVPEDIPVIFTTAYDEYAIKAFKVNSVDYLLKPVDEGELEAAVGFHLQEQEEPLSRPGRGLVPAYRHQGHSLFLQRGEIHIPPSYSLDQLEGMLDPGMFFRVSRGFITSIDAVVESTRYFGNRLVLRLEPEFPQRVLVSRGRVNAFLRWADGIYDETV